MQYKLGIDDYLFKQQKKSVDVVWDSNSVLNPHMLVCGKSGTGKTHLIRNFSLSASLNPRTTVHVFDVHGDIDVDGCLTIPFYENTQYGLNPLKIDTDIEFGGIRKRVQNFISTLNRTQSRKLGPKQESILRNLIIDLYEGCGFIQDKPETWALGFQSRYPNVKDLHSFAFDKLKQMYMGTNADSIAFLTDLNKYVKQLNFKKKKLNKLPDFNEKEIESLQDQIDVTIEKTIECFGRYIRSIQNGKEFENVIKYDSQDVLKSVVDRLENMLGTGIFKNNPIPYDPRARIIRYDIKSLHEEEQRLFVEFMIQDIFSQARKQGPVDYLRDMIVVDEADIFFTDDRDCVLNSVSKEGRKFGIGLLCASQSPAHFSEDFIGNVATKIILGIDSLYWDSTIKKMKIDAKMMNYITPRKTIAVQIINKEDIKSSFKQVYIGNH